MAGKTNWIGTIFVSIASLTIIIPLYMAVMIAVKNPQEMAQSLWALPAVIHWENFTRAIEMTNFFQAFKNSFIITFFAVVFTILTNSMVAYVIARKMEHSKFFKFLYYYFVSALFIPFPIIMLPIVKLASHTGINNPTGLTFLYVVYGISFNMFIYIGYIKSIPISLDEAAKVDGAGTWTTFWRVIFPLLAPINATIGILTALWAWNDFLLPLILLGDPDNMTLPLVQYIFKTKFGVDYNLSFASYMMALTPMIIVYLFAQKWIISNITSGAVKH